ncbi:hypothetical protein ACFQ3Z_39340 [Streptomyces nogalater]
MAGTVTVVDDEQAPVWFAATGTQQTSAIVPTTYSSSPSDTARATSSSMSRSP